MNNEIMIEYLMWLIIILSTIVIVGLITFSICFIIIFIQNYLKIKNMNNKIEH